MGYTAQGTLYIDSVDFWTFVQKVCGVDAIEEDLAHFGKPRFERTYEQVVFPYRCNATGDHLGEYVMDAVDFWSWVRDNAPIPEGAEFQFGVPVLQMADLEVSFVFSTESIEGLSETPKAVSEWNEIAELDSFNL